MKITVLMVAVYGICGVAAAAKMSSPGLLDSKLALIALFIMCSAHICWRAFARKRRARVSA